MAEDRGKAEQVFAERVEAGRAEAEKQFRDAAAKGTEEGEKMCGEMITVACQVWSDLNFPAAAANSDQLTTYR